MTLSIAVVGASGHTGGFVVDEVTRRGWRPVAIGRTATSLQKLSRSEPIERVVAAVDDPASLDDALNDVDVVVNCAGPFADTAAHVAAAAIRNGVHYLDIAAEQDPVKHVYDALHDRAVQAKVTMIPAAAFYGSLSDVLAAAALGDWDVADSVEVFAGLSSWHPTQGSRQTVNRHHTGNLVVDQGRLVATDNRDERQWDFGGVLGTHDVIQVPLSETIVLAHTDKFTRVRSYISTRAVTELLDPTTPQPDAIDAAGRSDQQFAMQVAVSRAGHTRVAGVAGRDSYYMAAPFIGEVIEQVLIDPPAAGGVRPLSSLVDASHFLRALDLNFAVS